jgi:hypothetical protein
VAICPQSRASAGEFCAQRGTQFKAQLGPESALWPSFEAVSFASFVMLSEALQRNAKHEARLSNTSGLFP